MDFIANKKQSRILPSFLPAESEKQDKGNLSHKHISGPKYGIING